MDLYDVLDQTVDPEAEATLAEVENGDEYRT